MREGITSLTTRVAALLGVEALEVSAATKEVPDDARVVVGTEAVLTRVRRASLVCFADLDDYLSAPRAHGSLAALRAIGLAGRLVGARGSSAPGHVLVQTRQPDHLAVAAAVRGDPSELVADEARVAAALSLPPHVALAALQRARRHLARRVARRAGRRPSPRSAARSSPSRPRTASCATRCRRWAVRPRRCASRSIRRGDDRRYPVDVGELEIRTYGDPVLREATREVDEIDGRLAALADTMIETMRAAPGVGLAANQIGIAKRVFVYDAGEGPVTVVNPRLVESEGEFTYLEGCLSVPGYAWEITRPNRVHLVGLDLDGNELSLGGRRVRGAHLPARARPPGRRAPRRAARPRPAQGGPGHAPQASSRASDAGPRRARVAARALMRLGFLRLPGLRGRASSTRWWTHGHDVAVVVTRADKRRGRGAATSPTAVKAAATRLGIEVTDDVSDLVGRGLELGVVVAYGAMVPARVLDGRADAEPALLAAAEMARRRPRSSARSSPATSATGVCVMGLEPTLDTGPVYARAGVDVDDKDLATLRDELVVLGGALLVDELAGGLDGLSVPEPQVGEATYASKVTDDELELDFTAPAAEVARVVRLGRARTVAAGRRLGVRRAVVVDDAEGAPRRAARRRRHVRRAAGSGSWPSSRRAAARWTPPRGAAGCATARPTYLGRQPAL